MKTRKNLFAAIICITSATLGSFGYASWTDNILPIENISTVNSCSTASQIYLNQDNDADGKADFYLYLNSNFILNGTVNNYTAGQILGNDNGVSYTTVQYYTPLPNMIYKVDSGNVPGLLDNSTFWRASRVFPYNTPLRGIATTPNKVVFEQPSDNDPNKNVISIVYNYEYKYAQGFDGTTNSLYRYNEIPTMNYMLNTGLTYTTLLPGSQGNRKRSWSAIQTTSNCRNYELHRCGNGIVETSNAGYMNQFVSEQCDGTAGVPTGYVCTNTCTLQKITSAPTCTLSVSSGSIVLGTAIQALWSINGIYTNTPQITYTPTTWSITGLPYNVPTTQGQRIITPTHTGAYTLSMMVSNNGGQSICTAQVLVNPPPEYVQCSLNINPNPVYVNQITSVGWNVVGGNFMGTYIYVSPLIAGSWPHRVNANQYNGSSLVMPTQTGNYLFSMMVSNNRGSYICTGLLVVIDQIPPTCSLTTTTPLITSGQTALLTASYTNATSAFMTPAIGGLNFTYPNRNASSLGVTPSTTTLYSLLVNGITGTTPALCQTTVTVTGSAPTCILSVLPSSTSPGAQVNIGWNVFGTFGATQITSIPPNTINGIPYAIAANTNAGSTIIQAPNTSGTYLVAMNVSNSYGSSLCTGSFTVNTNPHLSLTKTLINNILYHSGDIVSFKIDFANIGNTTTHHVVLSDYLPAGLEYVSSQIYGVSPYTFGTGINGINQYVEYSGFSLTPGQTGYMIISGKFKGYQRSTQTLNNAFLVSDETDMLYAAALFYVYVPSANATITKSADKASYYPGEDTRLTIAVTNNGPDIIDNVQLVDTRPTNNNGCVTADPLRIASAPMTMTNSNNPYTRLLNASLPVGQTVYLYLTGHIGINASCVGTYINNVDLNYTVNGIIKTGHANATINVSTMPSSTMTIQKSVVQYGNNTGDPIVFQLIYQNNGTATISSYNIVDYRPGTLHFTSASPMPTTQTSTSGGMLLNWIFTTPIAPNGTGMIILNGTIN